MKVLRKKEVERGKKELLLLSSDSIDESKIILHILINRNDGEFVARKIKQRNPIDEYLWEVETGYTFPSSIFYEFIKDGN